MAESCLIPGWCLDPRGGCSLGTNQKTEADKRLASLTKNSQHPSNRLTFPLLPLQYLQEIPAGELPTQRGWLPYGFQIKQLAPTRHPLSFKSKT